MNFKEEYTELQNNIIPDAEFLEQLARRMEQEKNCRREKHNDDIALDILESDGQKPLKVVVENRRTSLWKVALSAACLVCVLAVGTFAAVKLHDVLQTESGSSDPLTSDESSSSSSGSDSSETSDQSSDPIKEEQDPAILAQIRLEKNDLQKPEILNATEGLECDALFAVRGLNPNIWINDFCLTETGLSISMYGYYNHFFRTDRNGNELDHVAFSIFEKDPKIPDRDYPGTGLFDFSLGEMVWYSPNGNFQDPKVLPEYSRYLEFNSDLSQFLYIDGRDSGIGLYDIGLQSDIASLSAENIGFDYNSWIKIHMLTPKLAAVTMFQDNQRPDDPPDKDYSDTPARTFLLELPTLTVIQQLPDNADIIALNDDNFLIAKLEGGIRRITRARFADGRLTETETETGLSVNCEKESVFEKYTQYYVLSPDKKVLLLRDYDCEDPKVPSFSRTTFRAFSTDDMQLLWEFELPPGYERPMGAYTPAVISDDAQLYLFVETRDSSGKVYIGDVFLYRVRMK